MYYTMYKNIKQILAEAFGLTLDPESGIVRPRAEGCLQDIQWFNAQYEGTIHTAPVVFVEFAPLDLSERTKQTDETEIRIRLHVVTEVMDESDGDVWDADVERHERLAHHVVEALTNWRIDFEGKETRPLRVARWEHHHKYNGWMVTLIDLKTKG